MRTNRGDKAAWLLRQGFSIFPCHGKVPVTKHGVKDATKSYDEVFGWLRLWPDCGWAVACGEPSGVVVIDVDQSEQSIVRTMSDLFKLGVPDGNVIRTPSGGVHLYCKWRPGLSNKVRILGKPVDIRTDGGYVVHYGPGYEPLTWNGDFEPVPGWVVEACRPKPIVRKEVVTSKNPMLQANLMRKVGEGQRNHQLFKLAAWAVEDGGDLTALAQAAMDVGLPRWEVERTIDSAKRRVTSEV